MFTFILSIKKTSFNNNLNFIKMKNARITVSELAQLLASVKGNPIASLEMVTDQSKKVSKKVAKDRGLDPKDFFKFTKMAVQLGSTYSTRVNNQREKEGKEKDFEAQLGNVIKVSGALGMGAQEWNAHIQYAVVTPNRNQKSESFYIYQNNKADFKFIEQVFNPSALKNYKSNTQGVEDDILHMTVKLTSVSALIVNGVRYDIAQGK